jgi:hypothetical protein
MALSTINLFDFSRPHDYNRTEMTGLESQEEDDLKRILFFKPMSWLVQIRPHRRDETFTRVPPTRVPQRHTTGWLINSLTFFVQHIEWKRNRWTKTGVSIVGRWVSRISGECPSGNWPLFCNFRSSPCAIWPWLLPLPSRGVRLPP